MTERIEPARVGAIVSDISQRLRELSDSVLTLTCNLRNMATEASRLSRAQVDSRLFDATYKDSGVLSQNVLSIDNELESMESRIYAMRKCVWDAIRVYKYTLLINLGGDPIYEFTIVKGSDGWAVWSRQAPYGQIRSTTVDNALQCYINFNAVETVDIGVASPPDVPPHELSFNLHIVPDTSTGIKLICENIVYARLGETCNNGNYRVYRVP